MAKKDDVDERNPGNSRNKPRRRSDGKGRPSRLKPSTEGLVKMMRGDRVTLMLTRRRSKIT